MKGSLKIDVSVGDDKALHRHVVASIRRYRAIARHMFSVYTLAEAAGATIESTEAGVRVVPQSDKAKQLLAVLFDKNGKKHMYQFREYVLHELYEGAASFVWDSVSSDVSRNWRHSDPEFPFVSRGWLVLQGARRHARFDRLGIGCPMATARPQIRDHEVEVHWDKNIGPVKFFLARLDAGRWEIYQALLLARPG